MRRLVLSGLVAVFVMACFACASQAELERAEQDRQAQQAVADKARQDQVKKLWDNKWVTEDDPWIVQEVRASHVFLAGKPAEPGSAALGAAAGGSTAVVLGFTPAGIVLSSALGAAMTDGTAQQLGVDSATCVLVIEKSSNVKRTVVFYSKEQPKEAGVCLTSRAGDTILFRKITENLWNDWDIEKGYVDRKIRHELHLQAKTK